MYKNLYGITDILVLEGLNETLNNSNYAILLPSRQISVAVNLEKFGVIVLWTKQNIMVSEKPYCFV